jgi:DNA-binding winged helix-turn-helix (wHTH) protein
MYQKGNLRLDSQACEVTYRGNQIRLYPKEYELLKLFFEYANHVLSPSTIIDRLWFGDTIPTESAVRAHIKGLRRKLKEAGADDVIQTVHGLGYRLKPESSDSIKPKISLSPTIAQFITLHSMEYAILDGNLIIKELSADAKSFSDYPLDVAVGREAILAFPELTGLEPILLELLGNQRSTFNLKGIARTNNSKRPEYINLYLMAEPTEEYASARLLVLFEDCSEEMTWKQQMVQRDNEYNLILSQSKVG